MRFLTSFGIYGAIITGWFFPEVKILQFLVPWLLVGLLFLSFLELDFEPKKLFRRELIFYPVLHWLLFPFAVFLATAGLETDLRLGFMLVALTPSGISAPVIVALARGQKETAISHSVLFNLCSPMVYLIFFSLYFSGLDVRIPVMKIFGEILLIVFLPLVLSVCIKKLLKLKIDKLIFFGKIYKSLALILIIFIGVSAGAESFRKMEPGFILKLFAGTFLLAFLTFFSGYFVSRKPIIRRSIMIVYGQKNSGLAMWIALSNFGPLGVFPMLGYMIAHHLINGYLIFRYGKNSPELVD